MVVRFATHKAALKAKKAVALSDLCEGVDTLYNEHPYIGRGWWALPLHPPPPVPQPPDLAPSAASPLRCCCEDSVSRELIRRLAKFPKLQAELDKHPPKIFQVRTGGVPDPVRSQQGETNVEAEAEQINNSKLTSKGDQEKVVKLYKDYASKLASKLEQMLSLMASLKTGGTLELPVLPAVAFPLAASLRLADGKLAPG